MGMNVRSSIFDGNCRSPPYCPLATRVEINHLPAILEERGNVVFANTKIIREGEESAVSSVLHLQASLGPGLNRSIRICSIPVRYARSD